MQASETELARVSTWLKEHGPSAMTTEDEKQARKEIAADLKQALKPTTSNIKYKGLVASIKGMGAGLPHWPHTRRTTPENVNTNISEIVAEQRKEPIGKITLKMMRKTLRKTDTQVGGTFQISELEQAKDLRAEDTERLLRTAYSTAKWDGEKDSIGSIFPALPVKEASE